MGNNRQERSGPGYLLLYRMRIQGDGFLTAEQLEVKGLGNHFGVIDLDVVADREVHLDIRRREDLIEDIGQVLGEVFLHGRDQLGVDTQDRSMVGVVLLQFLIVLDRDEIL